LERQKPQCSSGLPKYFFIFVKVIGDFSLIDLEQSLTFSLIFVANRFNRPYYLGLNTGEWSGGETKKWLTVVVVVEKRQIVEAPEVPAAVHAAVEN
jgi:hypothetical protein